MNKTICVFSSSSDDIPKHFFDCANDLAQRISEKKYGLLYGGGNVGLMGAMAETAKKNKSKLIGVIPRLLHEKGYSYPDTSELIVTADMRDRKTVMEQRSDAFITLPGGFGTLEEFAELVTLRQLKYHSKPIILLNWHGYYDSLLKFFHQLFEQKFAMHNHEHIYRVVSDPASALLEIEREWASQTLHNSQPF